MARQCPRVGKILFVDLLFLCPDEIISQPEVNSELAQLESVLPSYEEEALSLSELVEYHLTAHFAEFGDDFTSPWALRPSS